MATPDAPDSGNRVTMAQVYRTVDDLKELVNAHFDGVKTRLDAMQGLPDKVTGIEQTLLDHEMRLLAGERDRKRLEQVKVEESSWRRTQLPALVISSLAVLVAVLTLFIH